MKKPNFFILGGPKCGTTSLAAWLAEHDRIFVSPRKEPHFFNDDTFHRRTILSLDDYEKLFANASDRHIAVGEASTGYAFSRTAVPNILAYAPEARFILCVRNPITMAPSLHQQRIFGGEEPLIEFGDAWRAQFPKRARSSIPNGHFDPEVYAYGAFCQMGAQLERLYSLVPREKVLVIFAEDMQSDPKREYLRVLHHLGVPDDERTDFPMLNRAKERKLLWVRQVALRLRSLKHQLGIKRKFGFLSGVEKWNKRERARSELSSDMTAELRAFFAEDIATLSALTSRNLDHWLQ